jgi:hypothetical protein
MGCINPDKIPGRKGRVLKKNDKNTFTQYRKGGKVHGSSCACMYCGGKV